MSSDYSSVSQFFSHPLVLLFIGAGISGVLIPYFTNRAAKYQKGLEIKTDLVRRINESVMPVSVSLYSLESQMLAMKILEREKRQTSNSALHLLKKELLDGVEDKKQLDHDELKESVDEISGQTRKQISEILDDKIERSIDLLGKLNAEAETEIKKWEVSSAVIGSQIKSYFPEFGVKTEGKLTWDDFDKTVSEAFAAVDVYAYRLRFVPGANKRLPSEPGDTPRKLEKLLKEKEQIVLQIQNSPVSGLSEHLFHRFFRKLRT